MNTIREKGVNKRINVSSFLGVPYFSLVAYSTN